MCKVCLFGEKFSFSSNFYDDDADIGLEDDVFI